MTTKRKSGKKKKVNAILCDKLNKKKPQHKTPEISKVLYDRIKLVRRDFGNLLFHFTRKPDQKEVKIKIDDRTTAFMPTSAWGVLSKILHEGKLIGTSKWTHGKNCVCFTEAPIQEFNSIFSLVEIAASRQEKPRYEPYGIAVSKKWLFEKGGRPVIYDHPDAFASLPEEQKYRFVSYDPLRGIDFTWEREWRINVDYLELDPSGTLVIVPTSEEAFQFVYEFADLEPNGDEDGPWGVYHSPKWLAVSLDIFGFGQ